MKQVLQMIAALVLCGVGMSAAGEVVPTVLEGVSYQSGNTYAGVYATEGHPDGGNVTIRAGESGQDMSLADIIGNWNDADNQRAYWATVTMTDGEVHDLYGAWCPNGDAGHSTVIMQGGTANNIIGGQSGTKNAYNNTVIMTGGTADWVTASVSASGNANFNNIYLLGKGAQATIDDVLYTNTDAITINRLFGASGNDLNHNIIDLYGTDINVERLDFSDILNLHLTVGDAPMLNLGKKLNLENVTLHFLYDNPAAAPLPESGSITLVNTAAEIWLTDEQLAATYAIMNGDTEVGKGRLQYTQGTGLTLQLIPEPTTPALTAAALALLLRRRRRKFDV